MLFNIISKIINYNKKQICFLKIKFLYKSKKKKNNNFVQLGFSIRIIMAMIYYVIFRQCFISNQFHVTCKFIKN